jgi:hypothetical protein
MAAKSTVPAGSGRKSERDPKDRYYTPWAVALGICQEWRHAIEGRDVLDPFVGGGVWLRAAPKVGAASVRGVDLDEEAPAVLAGEAVLGDGLAAIREARGSVVTNPPFALVNETIAAIVDGMTSRRLSSVVMLCRITTLEGVARAPLYARWWPERLIIMARRIRWEGPGGDALGGTDNFGAAAILWGQPTARGDTRTLMGWEPAGDDDGQMVIFGR